ncbi:MAG: PilW family protein [Nitrospirota bacterium]
MLNKRDIFDHLNNHKGISITEIMIAMGLSLIVGASTLNLFITYYKKYIIQEVIAEAQQNIRTGIEMISREIRMAGFDPTGMAFKTGKLTVDGKEAKKIIEATSTKIHILKELNGDGDFIKGLTTADNHEDITFEFREKDFTLRRKSGKGGAQVLSEEIESVRFRYYDRYGLPIPVPVADTGIIKRIDIYIKARIKKDIYKAKSDDKKQKREVATSVWLRNM